MFGSKMGGRAIRARLAPGALAVVAASVFIATLHAAPRAHAASGSGTPNGTTEPAHVAALLAGVRGASPVTCELAARAVYGSFSNGRGGNDGMSPDTGARALVSDVLDRDADVASVPALRTALGDADACVRRIAAPILGRIDHQSASDALVAALGDASVGTRLAGATGLAFLESKYAERARDPLVRALHDVDGGVRQAAAWALGRLELHGTAPPLIEALRDPESRVRAEAAVALGRLEDATAVPPLAELLRADPDPDARRSAAWALGQIK